MRRPLYSLGEVPADRSDPVLVRTRAAADALLAWMRTQPVDKGLPRLLEALRRFDSRLPDRVMRVATTLRARGMGLQPAVREAIARALADSSIDRIQAIGKAARAGMPVSGLGQTTPTTPTTSSSTDPGQAILNMFRGIVCSNSTSNSIADLVGKTQGADAHTATTTGIAVAQGAAQCSQLNQPATTTPTTPTPDTTTPAESAPNPMLSYGVPLLVLGGVVAVAYFAIKRRPKAA